ncbi:apurinic endonuclease family protein, partial [Vibrio parahaemolyticus VPTS-2010]
YCGYALFASNASK